MNTKVLSALALIVVAAVVAYIIFGGQESDGPSATATAPATSSKAAPTTKKANPADAPNAKSNKPKVRPPHPGRDRDVETGPADPPAVANQPGTFTEPVPSDRPWDIASPLPKLPGVYLHMEPDDLKAARPNANVLPDVLGIEREFEEKDPAEGVALARYQFSPLEPRVLRTVTFEMNEKMQGHYTFDDILGSKEGWPRGKLEYFEEGDARAAF